MADQSTIQSLLGGIEFDDPRLYDLLNLLIDDFYTLNNQINPPATQSKLPSGATGVGEITAVQNFAYRILPNNVRLTWDALPGASYFEMKYKFGTATAADWDTANSILQTSTTSADVDPISIPLVIGTHNFLIKAIGAFGIESTLPSIITFTILQISAPVLRATVIDNNVLLTWTAPISQFDIQYYNIYKGAVKYGIMKGTFEAIFETSAGLFLYGAEAVDVVGNVGLRGTLSVDVKSPPDYELQDRRISNLNGTKVNVIKLENYLLCNLNTTQTWGDHFTTRGWDQIQDQITAGYPLYAQPTMTTGSYEEVINYGVLLSNNIVTVRWSEEDISGDVDVVCKIASSTDGVVYTPFTVGTSVYYSDLQYVKIRFEFTAINDTELLKFYNLETLLDVKREVDSGQATALAIHGQTGTQVFFGKTFKDIDAIELTVAAKQPITAIYRFTDIPNPTFFHVLAYDSSGNQVDYLVSWMARGVV